MSLGEHLVELRKRLFRSALGLLVGAIVGWFLADFVLDALRGSDHRDRHAAGPSGAAQLRQHHRGVRPEDADRDDVGVVVSSPVWLYQIWAFLVPGLSRKELRYGFGFFFTAVPLFLAGASPAGSSCPHIVELLTSFAPGEDTAIITAKIYFDFVLKLVLAIGVAFVLPVFLVLLNFVGVLSAKSIIRSWRWAILVIVLFTAIATPAADVVSMFLLAIPMVAALLRRVGVAWLHDRRSRARRHCRCALEAELAGIGWACDRPAVPGRALRGVAVRVLASRCSRRSASGLRFDLDPFQREACASLEDGNSVLVAAPDGRGQDDRRRVRHLPRDAARRTRRSSTRRR